jgi:DNA helicase-2/ATP-dependent DNA helicase PcrA
MEELNEQQKIVIEHLDGPCLVIASPGSGKTKTIVERTIKLIEKGISSHNILCITFTNKAAKEMKDRICKRLRITKADFFIGTFHSLCANIIRTYGSKIGYTDKLSIMDESDQVHLIEKIIRQKGKSKKDDNIDVEKIINILNHSRERLETEEEILSNFKDVLFEEIAKEYLKQIKENNLIDFSGLLYEAVNLLKNHNDVLQKLQSLFLYIQVDEVQDTNYTQFALVNLLEGEKANIMMVGDLDQSIYKFRGARYQNILDFLKLHPNCKKITLGKNYRSTPQIVACADKLIKHNKSHMAEFFETDNPDGEEVSCNKHFDATYEAQSVAKKIKYYINELGWDYSDIAILYRLNRLSLELQSAFSVEGIPFTVIGGFNFFDRKEVKDTLSMLKFASNDKDTVAFSRIAGLFKGMGDVNIGSIENLSKSNGISLLDVCKRIDEFSNKVAVKNAAKKIYEAFGIDFSSMNSGDCMAYLVNKLDYLNYLQLHEKQEGEAIERTDNVNELIVNATEFSKKNNKIEAYLQNISLITASDKEGNENSVLLMTGHASKGLEFPIVFVVGIEQGILPHDWPIMEADTKEKKEEALEEERRILYVSQTRCKKHLNLSYCQNRKFRGKNGAFMYKKAFPSQFLKECGFEIKE